MLWVLICTVHLTVCSYHVTYAFQREFTFYSCLNVKELLVQCRREIWSLSDYNYTRNHNHLVYKRTLNHLAKLAEWLSCVVSTYLYSAFDYLFLSCHVQVSEWIHTLMHRTDNYSQHSSIEQGVCWYSGYYRVSIHSETFTWHVKNIQWEEMVWDARQCFHVDNEKEFFPSLIGIWS